MPSLPRPCSTGYYTTPRPSGLKARATAPKTRSRSDPSFTAFSVDASDDVKYWAALKKVARSFLQNGRTPVLLLENATVPAWVWDLQHQRITNDEYPKPHDMTVSQKEDMGQAYVCHFNDIAVYEAPIQNGASLRDEEKQLLKTRGRR